MSWKGKYLMCGRAAFLKAFEKGDDSMANLCRQLNISRKTGYHWLALLREEGEAVALNGKSRAPLNHPNATSCEMESAIIAVRQERPSWGPKKIAVVLARTWSADMIPSVSTIGDILKRNGLVIPRKIRQRSSPSSEPLVHATDCNVVWCVDFKGWFRTRDGHRIDPLTVTDAHSRYLLCCQGLCGKTNGIHVQAIFETIFRVYGLPERIRTDNGSPFASTGLAGLSRLAAWWIRLGIVPERIKPATPSENGRHERFHLTLKQETASPPASTPRKQQESFDRFRQCYNNERPHEALGQVTPVTYYTPSPRAYPVRLAPIEYGDDMIVRRVRGTGGDMKWGGKNIHVTPALSGEPIGLLPVDDGIWQVYFCSVPLGIFDERQLRIKRIK